MTKFQNCRQHSNKIERICLQKDCQDRLMCLLCDHQHGYFKSILIKESQNYKKFKNIINDAIDQYLFDLQNDQYSKIKQHQIQLINNYYNSLKKNLSQIIDQLKNINLKILDDQNVKIQQQLKNIRIKNNHSQVKKQLFQIFLKVYQGDKFIDLFSNRNLLKSQQAQQKLKQVNNSFKKIYEQYKIRYTLAPPSIKHLHLQKQIIQKRDLYQGDFIKKNLEIKLYNSSNTQFDSIISDCIISQKNILATSYDKKLRIIDNDLIILSEIQYENILTKIEQIDKETYAIGVSKVLTIQKINPQTNWQKKQLMKLRGHTERITDIHKYNTRIIGSSSDQGTKIWDLYKQTCQYTFKQNYGVSTFKFLPTIKSISIGYNDHSIRLYSIQNLKLIRKWELDGLPLFMSQQNLNQNLFYVSGFPSNLAIIDIRLNKLAINHNFQSEAISCFQQSIFQENIMFLGERGGKARLFDCKKLKSHHVWECHTGKTNASKPNGIVNVFISNKNTYLTVGCNDHKLKYWLVNQQ